MNYKEFKKAKKQMKQTYEPVCMPNFPNLEGIYYDFNEPYSLDSLTNRVPAPTEDLCIPAHVSMGQSNNKERDMSNTAIYNSTVGRIDSTVPTDQKQRDYTLGRLRDIKDQKYTDLRKQFGLVDDDVPVTFEDLMARIQAGKFIFPEDKKQKHYGIWSILDIIRWRDPSMKEDTDGLDKANAKLNEAYTTARDQTVLDVPTQGLKIIEDFKSLKLS